MDEGYSTNFRRVVGLHNALLRLYLGAIKYEIDDLIDSRIRMWLDGKELIQLRKYELMREKLLHRDE